MFLSVQIPFSGSIQFLKNILYKLLFFVRRRGTVILPAPLLDQCISIFPRNAEVHVSLHAMMKGMQIRTRRIFPAGYTRSGASASGAVPWKMRSSGVALGYLAMCMGLPLTNNTSISSPEGTEVLMIPSRKGFQSATKG